MRFLFVTPSEVSRGEAATAVAIATDLLAGGDRVHFVASRLTARAVRDCLPVSVTILSDHLGTNRRLWAQTLEAFDPNAVVFADYPLLRFSSGAPPLADDLWEADLAEAEMLTFTIDHLGYAQRPQTVFFGPPHLSSQSEDVRPLPERMRLLLPCPPWDVDHKTGRRGAPFRCWQVPIVVDEDNRRRIRQRYLRDEDAALLLHPVSSWARRYAELFQLPYYAHLPALLEEYLAGVNRPMTVVSVNGGGLLPPAEHIGICNLDALPAHEFNELLLSADLILTENAISTSVAKAACALRPVALLCNSLRLSEVLVQCDLAARRTARTMETARRGSVFPHKVFPIWSAEDLHQLGVLAQSGFTEAMTEVEIFGGTRSAATLRELLEHGPASAQLRAGQFAYIKRMAGLPSGAGILRAEVRRRTATQGRVVATGEPPP